MPMPKKTKVVLEMASETVLHHPHLKSQRAKWMVARRISVKQKTTTDVTKFVRCIQRPRRHLFHASCNVSVSNVAGA
jgi:hypothetical protein